MMNSYNLCCNEDLVSLIVLVLVICINIFAFEPNLHISQMMSLACKMLDDVINMHNFQKNYANILQNKFHHWTVADPENS